MKLVFVQIPYFGRFAKEILRLDNAAASGSFKINRFPNKELKIELQTDVKGKDCLIIGTISPPETQLINLLLLADALNYNQAKSIKLFAPYLAYSRQDKQKVGSGRGTALLGRLLKASGIEEAWTVDVHSELDIKQFPIELRSLSPARLIAKQVPELVSARVSIIAPDVGAIKRAELVSEALGSKLPVCYMHKVRRDGVEHIGLVGKTGERAIIIDDILDTGSTLLSCVRFLREAGVRYITAVVSHGVFTDNNWKKLFEEGIKKIYVTDSCPSAINLAEPRIKVISLKPMLSMLPQ